MALCSGQPKPNCKRRRIAAIRGRRLQHQLIASLTKYEIVLIADSTPPIRRVGKCGMHAVRHFVGEIDLRGKFVQSASNRSRPDLEVNMHGSYGIPAWINRLESCSPSCIGQLISAKKLLPRCVKFRILNIGVDASCIAVPDINLSIGQGLTVSRLETHDLEGEC